LWLCGTPIKRNETTDSPTDNILCLLGCFQKEQFKMTCQTCGGSKLVKSGIGVIECPECQLKPQQMKDETLARILFLALILAAMLA